MRTPKKEQLLRDVLADDSYRAFRAQLREAAIREARHRSARPGRRSLLALAACLPIGFCLYLMLPTRAPEQPQPGGAVTVVTTTPFPRGLIVRTVPFEAVFLASELSPVPVVTSVVGTGMVRSGVHRVERMTDDQLLALYKDHPVALVPLGPGESGLMFLGGGSSPLGP